MKRLRMAVIGAGHLGRIHARLLKTVESVDLVGVVDPRADSRRQVSDDLDVAGYAHLYDVLGKIDAAIVATPTSSHHDVALELLRSGVHCLVEKPLCATSDEAESLIRAAGGQRLALQVGHVERFNPTLAAVNYRPGELRYLEAVRAGSHSFRSVDVGVVLDLMIHDIDLALTLAGAELSSVQATGLTVVGPHEDLAQARLTFENGCVANLFASRVSPQPQRTLSLFSDELHAWLDLAGKTARLFRPCQELRSGKFDATSLSPAEQQHYKDQQFTELLPLETVRVADHNAILDEQQDFVQGILSGRPVRVPGEAGLAALAVAEGILAQIAANQPASRDESETLPLYSRGAAIPRPHFPLSARAVPAHSLRRAG